MLRSPWTLLNYGFRTFFLLGSAFAALAIAGWLLLLHGDGWPGAPADRLAWHSHEMLFGFVLAAVAGFLLTAMAAWTGRPPVQGARLGWLAAAWLAGRAGMALGGALSVWLVLILALMFPLLLLLTVGREILASGNRRNYPMVVIVSLFPLIDALYLLDVFGVLSGTRQAIYLMLHLVLLLITVIGGRIIPSFTTNWLRMQGVRRLPSGRAWLERVLPPLVVAVALADTFLPGTAVVGVIALVTALAQGLRLSGWRGSATWRNPLLLILHLGYGWLVVGYALLGLAAFEPALTHSMALHALTVGAMGTLILAVMSRVILGHTGRPLGAGWRTVVAYALVIAAALVRVLAPLSGGVYLSLIDLSGVLWIAAFAMFLWVYAPLLCRPRADGRPERVARAPLSNPRRISVS